MSFMSDAKTSRKREREDYNSRGPVLGRMHAVGGSSLSADDYRDSKRSKVSFVPTSTDDAHAIREDDRRFDEAKERRLRSEDSSRYGDPRDMRRDYGDRRGYQEEEAGARREYGRGSGEPESRYSKGRRGADLDEFGRDRR